MEKYQGYETLLIEKVQNKILKISFNLPEAYNAVNGLMHDELTKVFKEVARDKGTNVVILTGIGKAFSAGGNMEMMEQMTALKDEFMDVIYEGADLIRAILHMPQPLISMVNGPAIGLGTTIALYSDLIIASENAKFGDPHVKMGIVAGDGGTIIWPLLVGPAKAKEFLLTGRLLKAQEAKEIGLINEVVPADELEKTTLQWAEELAEGSRPAIQLTKRAINLVIEQLFYSNINASMAFEGITFQGDDVKEAVTAFQEKRKPKFK